MLLSQWNTRLILSARRREELERVKSGLNKKSGEVQILPLDLSEPSSLEGKAKEALSFFGQIDILILNGGISQRALALESSIVTDRQIMEINYFSGVILTKSVLPSMISNGFGHIAAVSSVTGRFGFPLRSAYSASKHALYGFYESLGAEYWDQGIRTTVVCPGRVQTNISLGALGPDGVACNVMDEGQKHGITSARCARDIVNGIRKNRREILSGGKEILMIYIKRFLPWLSYRLARKVSRR